MSAKSFITPKNAARSSQSASTTRSCSIALLRGGIKPKKTRWTMATTTSKLKPSTQKNQNSTPTSPLRQNITFAFASSGATASIRTISFTSTTSIKTLLGQSTHRKRSARPNRSFAASEHPVSS